MKALLLAAGLRDPPAAADRHAPKQLLPVGGRPMIDWILDRIAASGESTRSTSSRTRVKAADFEALGRRARTSIVHDDGTTSNEDRLGAIGDIRFAIEQGGLADDDLLVIAGDNLFEFSLADYIALLAREGRRQRDRRPRSADPSLAPLYGVVELDADDRVIGLEEKPRASAQRPGLDRDLPLLAASTSRSLERYLAEGNPPDPPGQFVAWLSSASRSTATASTRSGSTSATRRSCSRPTTGTARGAGLPLRTCYFPDASRAAARGASVDTELTQTRHGSPVP